MPNHVLESISATRHKPRRLARRLASQMRAKIVSKEQEKQALIYRLCIEKKALMFFYDEKPAQSISQQKVDESIAVVHPPYDYQTLEPWLRLGNWQAIFPANKAYQPFNTFKAKLPDILQRMNEAKLKLIIDSFHDNYEWHIIEKS